MSDEMNFSDEPLDTQSDFDGWEPAPEFAPPPPANTYPMFVKNIREIKEGESKVGKRIYATLDLCIQGGEFDGRAINFQRLNNIEFTRKDGKRTSFMLDMLKCGGLMQAPKSNKEFAVALQGFAERGPSSVFKGQIDWEGACATCRDKYLMSATSTSSIEDAKNLATKENWDGARKASVKAKNYRAFPMNPNGSRKDTFICPDCGEEVRAQVQIKRFIP